jgi:hypothetical protein
MIGNRICVIALTAVSAITGSAPPAMAQQFDPNWGMARAPMAQPFDPNWGMARPTTTRPFDGNWRIAAQTTRGHCEGIEFPLVIAGGRISSTAGGYGGYEARLSGRVAQSGRVQVHAVAGPRSAQGSGRLQQDQGSGVWAGRGPSGVCSGVWSAYRSWF